MRVLKIVSFQKLFSFANDFGLISASDGSGELKLDITSSKLDSDDIFVVNEGFTCPHRKVKIPVISQGSGATEDTQRQERVEEDRSIAVEAAVVRIMKARRQLVHQQLVSEVMQQLNFFRPNPKIIKQRIEHLIEREYLERDGENAQLYRYLA